MLISEMKIVLAEEAHTVFEKKRNNFS